MQTSPLSAWIRRCRTCLPRTPLEQIITGSAALLALIALFTGLALWQQSVGEIESAEQASVEAIAASLAMHIDGRVHEEWSAAYPQMDDLRSWEDAPASLTDTRDLLVQAHRVTSLITPIYTLRIRDGLRSKLQEHPDRTFPEAMEFLVTTASEPYWKHRYEYRPEMAPTLFRGEITSTEAYEDANGHWISGYAPVRDGSGRIVGLLEVDAPVDSELLATRFHVSGLLILMFLCFLGAFVLGGTLLGIMRHREIETERLALVASRTDNGVIITDAHGHIEWVNDGFSHMIGVPREAALGLTPVTIFTARKAPPADLEALREAFAERHAQKVDFPIERPDDSNETTYLGLEVQPVVDNGGHLRHFVVVQRDLSRSKRTEEMMIQARDEALQASRLKSEFLANVSHELRTPLNGILGVNELLLASELDSNQCDLVETSQRCGRSLLEMINEILDFAQMESGLAELRRIDFDLREMIIELIKETRGRVRGRDIHVTSRVAPEVPTWMSGDAIRLRQVINELLVNAAKFTEHGLIEISVDAGNPGRHDSRQEDPEGDRSSCLVRFEISDTGVGIPADRLDTIFDSFIQIDGSSTRSAGGTGLGLTVSQRNVELMGGRIGVRSVESQGSTFWFAVPLERPGESRADRLFDLSA